MRFFLIVCFLTVSTTWASGQCKRSNHWFFGYKAGLDFSSGYAQADTNGQLSSIEGCCSISDTAGNLLFYSNGEQVWNRNHQVMPNGNGLLGDQTCVESCVAIPAPGNASLYYLITTNTNLYTVRYSIIDMNLDNGLGDVTATKNVQLITYATEELAATMHCNAKDYWLVTRECITGPFKLNACLISSAGISSPVSSIFNLPNPVWNHVGSLTFSQNGSKLCFSSFGTNLYLFRFNKQSGSITLHDSISRIGNEMIYSSAFSPDGDKLYISSWNAGTYCHIYQFDLTAANINSSRVAIDSVYYGTGSPNGYGFLGQIRLAPDHKIYVTRWHQNYPFQINPNTFFSLDSIDVIHAPNLPGTACNYQKNYLYLDHKPTEIGLPNFVSNFTDSIIPTSNCTLNIEEQISLEQASVCPNPLITETTLRLNTPIQQGCLMMFNALGQNVKTIHNISGQSITITRDNLPAGLYHLCLTQQNSMVLSVPLVIIDW